MTPNRPNPACIYMLYIHLYIQVCKTSSYSGFTWISFLDPNRPNPACIYTNERSFKFCIYTSVQTLACHYAQASSSAVHAENSSHLDEGTSGAATSNEIKIVQMEYDEVKMSVGKGLQ